MFVVDGNAAIRRSYHVTADKKMTSDSGESTQAAFIFTKALLRMIEQQRPSHLAIAVDRVGSKEARRRLYPEYKANRDKALSTDLDSDYFEQEKVAHQVIEALGIPIISFPRYEADDVIATLVRRNPSGCSRTVIVGKDKDFYQLLGDNVLMYDMFDGTVLTVAEIESKVGYELSLSRDIQALMGDSTDGVPGVKGIGKKTAVTLLTEYRTIAGVYDNLDKLKPGIRKKLEAGAATLGIMRTLVTLVDSLPLSLCPIPPLVMDNAWKASAIKEFNRLGFKSLLGPVGLMNVA